MPAASTITMVQESSASGSAQQQHDAASAVGPMQSSSLSVSKDSIFRRISGVFVPSLRGDEGTHGGSAHALASNCSSPRAGGGMQGDFGTSAAPSDVSTRLESLNPLLLGQSLFRLPFSRTEDLAKYFDLPEGEILLDDYNCALRRRVLLQGRMYIFDHYVCFSSFVFGFARRVVIPMEDVVAVKKKTNLRFPNSIKLEMEPDPTTGVAKSYFFTSFLSREDAFKLISSCWDQSRNRRGMSVESMGAEARLAGEESASKGGDTPRTTPSGLNDAQRPSANDLQRGKRSSIVTTTRCQDDDDEEDEEDSGENTAVWGQITEGDVPALASDAKLVVQGVLAGTPQDVFDVLLANNSHLFEDFFEAQGNRRITIGSWKRDSQLGHVRDVQFVAPIKGAFSNWGVPTTQCFQSQRFRQFRGQHLVFESSQTMTDIPYGDCFTVDARWDVAPIASGEQDRAQATGSTTTASRAGPSAFALSPSIAALQSLEAEAAPEQVQVNITLRVPFSRSCLFKRVIEGGVVKQFKEQYTQLMDDLRAALATVACDRKPVQLGTAGTGTAGSGPAGSVDISGAASGMMRQSSCSNRTSAALRNAPSFAVFATGQGNGDGQQPTPKVGRSSSMRLWGAPRPPYGTVTDKALGALDAARELLADALGALFGEGGASPAQLLLTFLSFAVLLVQLLVLWRQTPPAGGGMVLPDGAWGSDAAGLASSQGLWAQRAAMLRSELELVQAHAKAVGDHLALALAQAQGAAGQS